MCFVSAAKDLNPGADAKRVLIIKLSALGDFVLATGAMKAVRLAHPSAEITLLTTPMLKGLAEACPWFDRVETDGRPKGLAAQYGLLKRISDQRFDIAYDFQTSGRTRNYGKLLRALPFFKAPLWSGVSGGPLEHANLGRGDLHSVDRLAEQLRDAGLSDELAATAPDLTWVRPALGDGPELQPEQFGLEAGKYALLIPGASAHRGAKRWPEDRYAALAGKIADAGLTPVILGAKAEEALAADICAAEPRTRNLTSKTSLFQIITLAERAAFVVGNDTGPMHMATIAGAPGIALFATDESDPAKACPRGAPVTVIDAPRADMIPVERVWDAIAAMGLVKA